MSYTKAPPGKWSLCGCKWTSHASEKKLRPLQAPLLPTTWLPVDLDHVTRNRKLALKMLLGFLGLKFGHFHMAKVDTAILFVFSAATLVSLNNSSYSGKKKKSCSISIPVRPVPVIQSECTIKSCFIFYHLIENKYKMNPLGLTFLRQHHCTFSTVSFTAIWD